MPRIELFQLKRIANSRLLILMIGICAFAFSVDAQLSRKTKTFGSRPIVVDGGVSTDTAEPNAVTAVDSDQCGNGPKAAPVGCVTASWQNGNLNVNNSHWNEGDAVVYRVSATGTPGSAGSMTISWDSTKSGVHALDYLTQYDRTEPAGAATNDPCSGGTRCNLGVFSTFPIPTDPDVAKGFDLLGGTSDDITVPAQGNFYLFGKTGDTVTIDNVGTAGSEYSLSGAYTSSAMRSITINFHFGASGAVMLAFGGHASTRTDWGIGHGSVNISGSPYHVDAGGHNLAITVNALVARATITIVKLVNVANLQFFDPLASFNFTSNGGPLGNFSLTDNDSSPTLGGSITGFTTNVKLAANDAGTPFTITEDAVQPPNANHYSFTQGNCVIAGGGFSNFSTATFGQTLATARTVTINPGQGNIITCTYTNGFSSPTAAAVSLGGRITDINGRGLSGITVNVTGMSSAYSIRTNTSGYYSLDGLEAGQTYIIAPTNARYQFNMQVLTMSDSLSNVNFIGYR